MDPLDPFSNSVWAHKSNLMKILFAVIQMTMIRWSQHFPHNKNLEIIGHADIFYQRQWNAISQSLHFVIIKLLFMLAWNRLMNQFPFQPSFEATVNLSLHLHSTDSARQTFRYGTIVISYFCRKSINNIRMTKCVKRYIAFTETSSGIHCTTGLCAIRVALASKIMSTSGYNFTYVTAGQLSW